LSTPPLTPTTSEGEAVHQLIYVEAVRAVAAEYDLPLVDHFRHWEAAATEIGGLERWFDGESRHPGRVGHEQMARRLFADLRLLPTASNVVPRG
jgi:lysophospholipase L1-like esterase